jgi:hypothetical protein
MTSRTARVDEGMLDEAEVAGALTGLSADEQFVQWARLGRAVQSANSAVWAVITHQRDFDSLGAEDQAAVRTLWEMQMAARIADLDLVGELEASGCAYAYLDEDGHLVEVGRRQGQEPRRQAT